MISATQIRKGMLILHEGIPHRVMSFEHRSPGKGAAFVRALLRNLESGASYEIRYASNDSVERAILEQHEMEYLYAEGDFYHFMNTETFEQIMLDSETLGDYIKFMKEGQQIVVEFFNGKPIGIDPPNSVDLEVVETEPELRGATASNSPKPATLETGAVIQVPPFIKVGDVVRVSIAEGKYLERAK
ncbi:MAG: elongation factor P [Acidobacteriota bacterium]|nr:MAG: elongation factor P [Acidobacteriota bacterium]